MCDVAVALCLGRLGKHAGRASGGVARKGRRSQGAISAVGSDVSITHLNGAAHNASAAGVNAAFLRCDSGSIPVVTGMADCVVANPPWGRVVHQAGKLTSGPEPLWRELRRVLKGDGRCLLLLGEGLDSWHLEEVGFSPKELFRVRVLGQWALAVQCLPT